VAGNSLDETLCVCLCVRVCVIANLGWDDVGLAATRNDNWLWLMVALIDCVWSMASLARLTMTKCSLNGRSVRSYVQLCNVY